MNVQLDDNVWLRIDRDIIEGGTLVKGKEKAFTRQLKAAGGVKPITKTAAQYITVSYVDKVYYFYLGD